MLQMLEKGRIAAEVTGLNLKVLVRKLALFPWSSNWVPLTLIRGEACPSKFAMGLGHFALLIT